MFGVLPASLGYIEFGQVHALAVTSPKRQAVLPELPAMAEFLPSSAYGWYAVCAPKGTPAEIVEKLNKEINAALADAKTQKRFTDLGCAVFSGSPADFGNFIADDTEKWGKVMRAPASGRSDATGSSGAFSLTAPWAVFRPWSGSAYLPERWTFAGTMH